MSKKETEPRYHEAAFTLDPNNPIEDDAPPAAGLNEDDAERVKAAADAHTEASEAEGKEAAKRSQEARTDLKPSEALRETGREPSPEKESKSEKKGK